MTPQAVGQQTRLLENILQVPLFDRKPKAIQPTEKALLLFHFVKGGFAELHQGIARIPEQVQRPRNNVNVSPYFAKRHLIARLERFRKLMPAVDIRITTLLHVRDMTDHDLDAAIQWGFGKWEDYDVNLLLKDSKIICCSPQIGNQISKPADLTRTTLLHPALAKNFWRKVFLHLNVDTLPAAAGVQLPDAETMRQATLVGLGVGVLSTPDALADIKAGRLVAPLGAAALGEKPMSDVPGFYLVVPRAHKRVKLVSEFCDWIISEMSCPARQ